MVLVQCQNYFPKHLRLWVPSPVVENTLKKKLPTQSEKQGVKLNVPSLQPYLDFLPSSFFQEGNYQATANVHLLAHQLTAPEVRCSANILTKNVPSPLSLQQTTRVSGTGITILSHALGIHPVLLHHFREGNEILLVKFLTPGTVANTFFNDKVIQRTLSAKTGEKKHCPFENYNVWSTSILHRNIYLSWKAAIHQRWEVLFLSDMKTSGLGTQ